MTDSPSLTDHMVQANLLDTSPFFICPNGCSKQVIFCVYTTLDVKLWANLETSDVLQMSGGVAELRCLVPLHHVCPEIHETLRLMHTDCINTKGHFT